MKISMCFPRPISSAQLDDPFVSDSLPKYIEMPLALDDSRSLMSRKAGSTGARFWEEESLLGLDLS